MNGSDFLYTFRTYKLYYNDAFPLIFRGLRYHNPRPLPLKELEANHACRAAIEFKCQELDEQYQEQVRKCLALLLSHGADPNQLPGSCPKIMHDMDWSEGYETKIIQADNRWKLLGVGASMKIFKYHRFDAVASTSQTPNIHGITALHIAAWRGDAQCLELIVRKGRAAINARATDGRNALHFLYQYCMRPSDLVACTRLLVQHGIDVHAQAVDTGDCTTSSISTNSSSALTPVDVLLAHAFVKRSHVRHLAVAFTADLSPDNFTKDPDDPDHTPPQDNYHQEILECLDILFQAGAPLNRCDRNGATCLHMLYTKFYRCLRDADDEFQSRNGHDIVPYAFTVKPLLVFPTFLLNSGLNVSIIYEQSTAFFHRLFHLVSYHYSIGF